MVVCESMELRAFLVCEVGLLGLQGEKGYLYVSGG